jgi:hypothetical protein
MGRRARALPTCSVLPSASSRRSASAAPAGLPSCS